MRRLSPTTLLGLLAVCIATLTSSVSASVFLPHNLNSRSLSSRHPSRSSDLHFGTRQRRHQARNKAVAMAIPGYGVAEQVFVGGFSNFLSIYNVVITVRILLSWFPQAQGIAALQPVFAVTDPFLNLFRGVIPPIGGLDLSPLAAFFLLNVVTNATSAIGAEIPEHIQKRLNKKRFGRAASTVPFPLMQ